MDGAVVAQPFEPFAHLERSRSLGQPVDGDLNADALAGFDQVANVRHARLVFSHKDDYELGMNPRIA